jgi:hypothetical protein
MEARRRWARLRLLSRVEQEVAAVDEAWQAQEAAAEQFGLGANDVRSCLPLADAIIRRLMEAALPIASVGRGGRQPRSGGVHLAYWTRAPQQPVVKVNWIVDEIVTLDTLVEGGAMMKLATIMSYAVGEVLEAAGLDVQQFGSDELLVRWGTVQAG